MPGPNTPITDREKAAILALKLGIIQDSKTAYICAEDKAIRDVPQSSLKSMISKWINSEKVRNFSDYITRYLADRETDARKRGRQEAERDFYKNVDEAGRNERTENGRLSSIDFYDPVNQRKQINRIIIQSQDDPKTQLDAIKAIQQTQRDDKQAAKDQQIQRFYTPVRCQICPIRQEYEKRQARKATK